MRSNADLDISKFGTEDEADALIAECADRGLALAKAARLARAGRRLRLRITYR